MKRVLPLVLFLAALSALAGYLVTKGTWLGRKGMRIFHKEYLFLNTWWEGTSAIFGTLVLLLCMHAVIQRFLRHKIAKIIHVIFLLAAIAGLYLNFYDFRHDWEHHLMGERFHLGFYLFWVGWIVIAIFFILFKKKRAFTDADNKAGAIQ